MKDVIVNPHAMSELPKGMRGALVACGLWLPVGFIGASGVAVGLIQLFRGDVQPLSALTLAGGGAVLAAMSWWRAKTILDPADGAAQGTASAPSPAGTHAAVGT